MKKDEVQEIKTQIEILRSIKESKKIKRSMVKECLSSVRNILEGITGNVVAAGLVYLISQI
ncbi:hypothetical protein [Sporosalibacterium faouarense]|uniref:hypothetical protein n=1 Tax=Sporosalibacterium faouarense TaxID=516123 RepID=UPI00192B7263|nr:hypothetical protein [Sporosalibacterium faouarense]